MRNGAIRSAVALGIVLCLVPAVAGANRRPSAGSVSPGGGTGNPQLFTASFNDPDGWRTLKYALLRISSISDPSRTVTVRYRVGTGLLSLNDGGVWRGGLKPGAPSAVAGALGRLYARHCRASGSGSRLTLKFFIGLKAGLEDRDLLLEIRAVDRSGAASPWKAAGTWRAPAPQPLPFPVFPADNPWNTDISGFPVHPDSAAFIASIGAGRGLHADFGTEWQGSPIGIPYVTVGAAQPRVPVSFYYADESDPGPYPIPSTAPVEGGPYATGDRHVLVVDTESRVLYETFDARRSGAGWAAGSGAVFDLASNALRPDGWTSADAAGLPIFAGLVRYEEVEAGAIPHALRFTASRTRRAYIHPATHFASSSTDPALPPMGLRVRLKASFDTSGFPPRVRTILQALKTYGMLLADNGSDWFISGAPNENWDDDELHLLGLVTGADFEAVDTGSVLP